jgi:hypothetical protein
MKALADGNQGYIVQADLNEAGGTQADPGGSKSQPIQLT